MRKAVRALGWFTAGVAAVSVPAYKAGYSMGYFRGVMDGLSRHVTSLMWAARGKGRP